jgi:predicted ArsR family transcriptional regulator
MPKKVMRRTAADSVYLHKDFHGALSAGIEYVHQCYGAQAVRDYLRRFAASYYAPLTAAMRQRGLAAMKEHLERVYQTEGGTIEITCSEDELLLEVMACPAITHMRACGYPVARLFCETTRSVFAAICEDTPFAVEVLEYDDSTGGSRVRFHRRRE